MTSVRTCRDLCISNIAFSRRGRIGAVGLSSVGIDRYVSSYAARCRHSDCRQPIVSAVLGQAARPLPDSDPT